MVVATGNVSIYHPASAEPLRLRLGGLSVGPVKGFNTLGDVAMLNGMAVITAKQGMLRLEGNGSAVEVHKGRTIAVPVKVTRAPQGAPSAAAGPPPQHTGGSSSLLPWTGVGAGVEARGHSWRHGDIRTVTMRATRRTMRLRLLRPQRPQPPRRRAQRRRRRATA